VVVERRVIDRFAEDAEVLPRDARVLDLREAALVRVRVKEVAGLDVRRRRLATQVLRLGRDAVEERGRDLRLDVELRLAKVLRQDRRGRALVVPEGAARD